MSESIFDRLQKKLDVQKSEEGISALDLAQLPPNLRRVMRLMLREIEMTRSAIMEAIDSLPEEQRPGHEELDEALKTLSQQGWLICRGEGGRMNYTVNLRRKRGSTLEAGIFQALENKIARNDKAE
jgi:hypothetical protein